jgi:hypothetical protein
LFALEWHHAIAILFVELDKLFMLLMPELVVWFELVGGVSFPSEPNLVQESLSIKSHFVIDKSAPLKTDPLPK